MDRPTSSVLDIFIPAYFHSSILLSIFIPSTHSAFCSTNWPTWTLSPDSLAHWASCWVGPTESQGKNQREGEKRLGYLFHRLLPVVLLEAGCVHDWRSQPFSYSPLCLWVPVLAPSCHFFRPESLTLWPAFAPRISGRVIVYSLSPGKKNNNKKQPSNWPIMSTIQRIMQNISVLFPWDELHMRQHQMGATIPFRSHLLLSFLFFSSALSPGSSPSNVVKFMEIPVPITVLGGQWWNLPIL